MAITAERTGGVESVLARLDALTAQRTVTVRDIVDAFGDSASLPVMMVPALIIVSPLSGIPFLPTVLGSVIAIVALQALLGRSGLWLPDVLMRRSVRGDRLHRALERVHRAADWVDAHARPRLRILVRPPLDVFPKAMCFLAGAAMPLLELLPFSSSLLGMAVVFFTAALLLEDGLYAVIGIVFFAAAAVIPLSVYAGVLGLAG